jgi:hypothetical protein
MHSQDLCRFLVSMQFSPYENAVVVPASSCIGLHQLLLDVLICFILSATLSTDGGLSLGPLLGALPVFGFDGAFWEVEFFGSSFVNGRNSGDPGMYFRNGTGTLMPWKR